jgi:hypothetical protein
MRQVHPSIALKRDNDVLTRPTREASGQRTGRRVGTGK